MNRRLWLVMMLALVALGCSDGPRRAPVRGMVRVDGKPLERGVIRFLPVNGTVGPDAGAEIQNGEFSLARGEGPVIGSNRVVILGFRKTGRKINVMGAVTDEEVQAVPAEFNERSTLVRQIEADGNEFEFDLPGRRGK